MNQGLAVHIITTLIYIGLVYYILDGEQTNISMRTLVVVFGLLSNVIAALICVFHDLYNKKTQ